MDSLQVFPVRHAPAIRPGDPLERILMEALRASGLELLEGDVMAVCQKIVSKAEGRVVDLQQVAPSERARSWAEAHGKDPRVVEVVLRQARRIVRMEQGVIIAETETGLVCANAGVDQSNAHLPDHVILLPADPDASAERLRQTWTGELGRPLAVVITDTFGRPWREGLVDVAIGVAGLKPLIDLRGSKDWTGRTLETTALALADQVAAAAGLTMGKSTGTPAAIVRGVQAWLGKGGADTLRRPAETDLFR
jgi:coenzyme F420-0:L-glutamate ligase/coenzyme F420-1:gamma-L-glutamate ligase